MGSYGYIPNRDAANTIMSEICPKTRKLDPRSVFVFTGRRTDKLKVPPGRGIAVLGVVENVVDYINAASICIAPLRFGSGTRLKILEWMACERPIIASKKAAEGLDVEDGRNIIIEDDFSKYPELIAKLNSNPELCESLGRNARKLVIEQHDWRVVGKELARVLRNV
jgi:glycosyltransferase involved in cell wall biosynthesis